ncbi:hypothetical protein [Thalassolituus oleivorans]|uniref:hypothetical protein n=1 Tax=Thalassolituus oleivorans TaxID=187493 RepID=UPI00042DBC31|nr:hypothetical protein [Thalassolituus oleivorans]AHK14740.1 hypothetical protein R615_01020 [Thalassolituus oleivorans R6-15]MCA6127633.1 hypothetical protein [Thalassolituus oleivorans 4BN06-13]
MKSLVTFSALLALSAPTLAATDTRMVCQHEGSVRLIEVIYSGDYDVPCDVRYTKDDGVQVLWSAAFEVGYCEAQAAAFVEKQRAWGWSCDAEAIDDAQTPAVEEAQVSNTDNSLMADLPESN